MCKKIVRRILFVGLVSCGAAFLASAKAPASKAQDNESKIYPATAEVVELDRASDLFHRTQLQLRRLRGLVPGRPRINDHGRQQNAGDSS